jgi:hypothetical protein
MMYLFGIVGSGIPMVAIDLVVSEAHGQKLVSCESPGGTEIMNEILASKAAHTSFLKFSLEAKSGDCFILPKKHCEDTILMFVKLGTEWWP